jgi:ATP-binding cassette subfamily F protein 3
VEFASPLTVGYYAQDASDLNPGHTVLQELIAARPDLLEASARNILGRFLFRGDDVFKPVAALSGGEQSRLRLVKLILSSPQLLILDEPTNHLDIDSREALEEALIDYPGAILAVSHDRYFLDRIVNRLLVMRAGSHRLYRGNYTHYAEQSAADQAKARADQEAASRTAQKPRAARAAPAPPRPPKSKFEKFTLDALEAGIIEREQKIADLTERFGDPAVARDRAKLSELNLEMEKLRAELAEMEMVWNRRAEAG